MKVSFTIATLLTLSLHINLTSSLQSSQIKSTPGSSSYQRKVVVKESTPPLPNNVIGFGAAQTVEAMARTVSGGRAKNVNTEKILSRPQIPLEGDGEYKPTSLNSTDDITKPYVETEDDRQITAALAKLERDMLKLNDIAAGRPQLSNVELTLLSLVVSIAATSPALLPFKYTELLAPAAAAFSASIGIGAEFVGKVAVADGKEVAANTLQCAAEAESLFAKAERTKAVLPLCVGVGATGATFTLLAPTLIESIAKGNTQLLTELYLLCPLITILAAAVSSLALLEIQSQTARAISVGNRRFAKAGSVGRTWLSTYEQIQQISNSQTQKWRSFAWSIIPAPVLGSIVPGDIATKTVFVSAIAACQSAYYLAMAENTLARGQDAVALKARSAAVCDSYANQGARSAAILPFTSALSSLCAAATAAVVELPFVEALGHAGGAGVFAQTGMIAFFPTLASFLAAAASVSKARCEVGSEAATQAAATMALEYDSDPSVINERENDPVMKPWSNVLNLISCSTRNIWCRIIDNTKMGKYILNPFFRRLQNLKMKFKPKRG